MKDEEKGEKIVRAFAGFMLAFVIAVLAASVALCLGGCSSTRIGTDAGDVRQSNSYIVGALETSVGEFDEGIREARIESQGIEDDIERIIHLFNQYERAALRLRDEVDNLRAKIKDAEKAFDGGAGVNNSVYPSESGDVGVEDKGSETP